MQQMSIFLLSGLFSRSFQVFFSSGTSFGQISRAEIFRKKNIHQLFFRSSLLRLGFTSSQCKKVYACSGKVIRHQVLLSRITRLGQMGVRPAILNTSIEWLGIQKQMPRKIQLLMQHGFGCQFKIQGKERFLGCVIVPYIGQSDTCSKQHTEKAVLSLSAAISYTVSTL